MKSMTGYGKSTVGLEGCEISVELKSVNHRYLDLNTKIPRMFNSCEDIIRSVLSKNLSRGHIDVYVKFVQETDQLKTVTLDMGMAKGYIDAANKLAQQFGLKDDFQLSALMKSADVIKIEQQEENVELLRQLLTQAMTVAVTELNSMREIEGKKLKEEIENRLSTVSSLVESIKQFAPEVAKDYQQKLTIRITEALKSVELDQARLLNEVAFFVDKSNVDEEIARLTSHISAVFDILQQNQPSGKRLDFLVQELNREANTICSKSNNATLTGLALQLKNEIEKIREQVQNLE